MMKYERLTKQAGWHKDIDLKDELGYSYIYQRLAEWENDYESGKVVKLPCKVGDTVYYETFINSESQGIKPHKVIGFVLEVVTQDIGGFGCTAVPIRDFGKDVFLTHEEAEKRLKEIQE